MRYEKYDAERANLRLERLIRTHSKKITNKGFEQAHEHAVKIHNQLKQSVDGDNYVDPSFIEAFKVFEEISNLIDKKYSQLTNAECEVEQFVAEYIQALKKEIKCNSEIYWTLEFMKTYKGERFKLQLEKTQEGKGILKIGGGAFIGVPYKDGKFLLFPFSTSLTVIRELIDWKTAGRGQYSKEDLFKMKSPAVCIPIPGEKDKFEVVEKIKFE